MPKPLFIIVAGPNGAGKSTASKKMLEQYGIEAFDWDAEFYKNWSRFGYDPAVKDGVKDRTTELFNEHLDNAIANGKSVAYETNFHIDYHFQRLNEAREKGYETLVYFFYVNSIKICNARVELRHESGGHFVDPKTVQYRWEEGLKRLDKAINNVDQVLIFDTSEDYKISGLAVVWNDDVISYVPDDIDELKKHLPSLREMLSST